MGRWVRARAHGGVFTGEGNMILVRPTQWSARICLTPLITSGMAHLPPQQPRESCGGGKVSSTPAKLAGDGAAQRGDGRGSSALGARVRCIAQQQMPDSSRSFATRVGGERDNSVEVKTYDTRRSCLEARLTCVLSFVGDGSASTASTSIAPCSHACQCTQKKARGS